MDGEFPKLRLVAYDHNDRVPDRRGVLSKAKPYSPHSERLHQSSREPLPLADTTGWGRRGRRGFGGGLWPGGGGERPSRLVPEGDVDQTNEE